MENDFVVNDSEYQPKTETETQPETETETQPETETETQPETETETQPETVDYSSQLETLILIETENQEILQSQYNALHGMTNVFVFSLIVFLGGWIAIKIFLQLF